MKRKKLLALLMAGAMSASLLTGCGSSGPETTSNSGSDGTATVSDDTDVKTEKEHNPVTITITYAGGDETATAATQAIIDGFEETYDWITVIQDASTSGSYDDYVATLANTGEFPDIIEIRDPESYSSAGYIAAIPDELLSLLSNPESQEIDGVVYTMPATGSTPNGIIYNVDYLASLGYEDIGAVLTWDEFIEICEAVEADGSMDALAVGGADQWHMGFWYNKLWSDYVLKTNEDFIADVYAGTCSFLDEEPRAVIEALVELWEHVGDGWASTGDADLATLLVNNMAAMYFSGTWMFTTISEAAPDFNYGFFTVADKEDWLAIVGGSTAGGWAVSSEAAADPDKLEAFELFMEYFFSEDVYVTYLQAVSSVYSTAYPVTYEAAEVMDEVYEAMEAADYSVVMWNTQTGDLALPDGFRNFVYKTVQEVLQGTTDIDTAMQNIQAYWEECVATAAE